MKKSFFGMCFVLLLTNQTLAQDVNVDVGAVEVEVLAKTSLSWDGMALPDYKEGEPEITILKITIPPKTELALHKHPVINAGVLLTGELTVITEQGEILYLKVGDSIIEVVEKWHYGKNEGSEQAEIIVFYAGIKGVPITIKKTNETEGGYNE